MRLVCGGERHELLLREHGGQLEVRVDGEVHRARVLKVAAGTFVISRDGRREVFHCVRDGDAVHLHWRGVAYRLALEREGARGAHRHAEGSLEAPMPGKVIKLSVAVGQTVGKGDEILVVEAMKMESSVRAPRAGRVRSLAVKVGDAVAPGLLLAEIE